MFAGDSTSDSKVSPRRREKCRRSAIKTRYSPGTLQVLSNSHVRSCKVKSSHVRSVLLFFIPWLCRCAMRRQTDIPPRCDRGPVGANRLFYRLQWLAFVWNVPGWRTSQQQVKRIGCKPQTDWTKQFLPCFWSYAGGPAVAYSHNWSGTIQRRA